MSFNNPEYLYLLLLLLPVLAWYIFKQYQADASLQISSLQKLATLSEKLSTKILFHIPFILRFLALILLIIVIARPTLSNSVRNETTEGIDIVLAMDISGTMLAEDLRPNRLEAAKRVAIEFIVERPNDNIGLVVFAGESFTQCPLTTDHAVLINLFNGIKYGIIEDGTAIGMGLANAVSRIKDSNAKSKVVILLTDGSNNAGEIAPITAAEIAKTFGVRVYTIGVGTRGMARYPVQTPVGIRYQDMPVDIDEDMLRQISGMTGGRYFRATDNDNLKAIYAEIDQMEKTKIAVKEYKKKTEIYLPFAIVAFLLIVVEVILKNTVLKKLP
ncbi:MAG: VWA domain-containing protein [Paludibacteraceae bacterium]|nr:VWA domain-containing protein [Paludibacteraceae bacterium]